MGEKRDVIYLSSKEALIKIFVLILTIGISTWSSLLDYKACYITILLLACNNIYDFYKFTDNTKYATMVKREAIAIVLCAIIAIIISVIALLELYKITQATWIKIITILFVTIPLGIVFNDYKINIKKENDMEG